MNLLVKFLLQALHGVHNARLLVVLLADSLLVQFVPLQDAASDQLNLVLDLVLTHNL